MTKQLTLWTLQPDGSSTREVFDGPPGLETLQKAVGGYIELVPMFDTVAVEGRKVPAVVFCNEEGKLDGLPINPNATELWSNAAGYDLADVLVGPVAVIYGDRALLDRL